MTDTVIPPAPPLIPGDTLPAGLYTLRHDLDPDQVEALGRELDDLNRRQRQSLGAADADYIRRVMRAQKALAIGGRALFYVGFFPPAWIAGVLALGAAKIIDNMEIGHNVMHGQYDWMRDPAVNSQTFEWDNVCPAEQWRYTHNVVHHTNTNILRKDGDLGYGSFRVTPRQRWRPYYLGNLAYAAILGTLFEWGVAMHGLDLPGRIAGRRTREQNRPLVRQFRRKAARQVLKDYVLFPVLTGPLFLSTLAGNAAANVVRNVWAFLVIACGHFPDGSVVFDHNQIGQENRGMWYVRQIVTSTNIRGGRLIHLMTGNLSLHIEHHLFPDLPARRYLAVSHEVQDICRRYGIPYKTGPMYRQVGSVLKHLARLSLPTR